MLSLHGAGPDHFFLEPKNISCFLACQAVSPGRGIVCNLGAEPAGWIWELLVYQPVEKFHVSWDIQIKPRLSGFLRKAILKSLSGSGPESKKMSIIVATGIDPDPDF